MEKEEVLGGQYLHTTHHHVVAHVRFFIVRIKQDARHRGHKIYITPNERMD